MTDEFKEAVDEQTPEMQEAIKEAFPEETKETPQPPVEVKQEETPETKIEETKETPKETPEVKKPTFHTVPLSKYVNTEKELKTARKELELLKNKSQQADTPEEQEEVSESLDAFAKANDMDSKTLTALQKVILAPLQNKLKSLDKYSLEQEQLRQNKEAEAYLSSEFEKIMPVIKAEHGELTEIQLGVFKQQLLQEANNRGVGDLALLYKAIDTFRIKKDIRTAEPKSERTNTKPKIGSKIPETMEDVRDMSDDEIAKMVDDS